MKVGIAKLKSELSSYIAETKKGRKITITDRGLPVAQIIPIDSVAADNPEVVIARLALTKELTSATPSSNKKVKKRNVANIEGHSVSDLLTNMRDEE